MKNRILLALMDEYRKCTIEYKQILATLPQSLFEQVFDETTKDDDCRSIQTITTHIVHSGHTYANYVKSLYEKEWVEFSEIILTPQKGIEGIDKMLDYTEASFGPIWDKTNEEIENWKFDTRWGVTYDFEQLMEHAIVHVLRHRRQVEMMLSRDRN